MENSYRVHERVIVAPFNYYTAYIVSNKKKNIKIIVSNNLLNFSIKATIFCIHTRYTIHLITVITVSIAPYLPLVACA